MKTSEKLLRIILTGSTGMVGEGVLHECLQSNLVESVLVVNRKTCGIRHPKLKEVLHPDFFNLDAIRENLRGYNTCLFCLGVSSVGMKKEDYERFTYDLTMHIAKTVLEQNTGSTFCYISGAGTDSSEKGRIHWARVKGKTENELSRLGFAAVYNFRPAMLQPTPGLKNTLSFYKYLGWLFPILRRVAPNSICSLSDLGKAMLNAARSGYSKTILEVNDIKTLAAD